MICLLASESDGIDKLLSYINNKHCHGSYLS